MDINVRPVGGLRERRQLRRRHVREYVEHNVVVEDVRHGAADFHGGRRRRRRFEG